MCLIWDENPHRVFVCLVWTLSLFSLEVIVVYRLFNVSLFHLSFSQIEKTDSSLYSMDIPPVHICHSVSSIILKHLYIPKFQASS